ncbi:MAG: hypothetical protein JNL79_00425 [Myxococcales bacterium]|nr:hypothetical protein [Myxococcales bacterium]
MAYLPCPECRRHVHVDERACPFCAREVRLGRTSRGAIAFFACALAMGCKDKPKEIAPLDPATVKKSAVPSSSLTPKEEEQMKAALKEELKKALDPRQADIYGAPPVPPSAPGSGSASSVGPPKPKAP